MNLKANNTQKNKGIFSNGFVVAGFALFLVVFFKNAWVCEDAYIFFRSLEQLFNGNGPVWNAHARVQVYTSVIWYWLNAFIAFFYRDYFIVSIMLSAVCCGLMLYYTARIIEHAKLFLIFVLLLIASRSFFDYTSSGLENALAFTLISAFVFYLKQFLVVGQDRERQEQQSCFLALCVLVGLSPLVRHDLVLLLAPGFAWAAIVRWQHWRHGLISRTILFWPLVALFMPPLLWTLFSLIYYGIPLPNTAYAKLNHGVPRELIMEYGSRYFVAHWYWDTPVIVALLLSIVCGLFSRIALLRVLAAGVLLHITYLYTIGGDYMLGRFLSIPYFLAVLLLVLQLAIWKPLKLWRYINAVVLLGCCALWFTFTSYGNNPLTSPLNWGKDKDRVARTINKNFDSRYGEFVSNSLWVYQKKDFSNSITDHNWCNKGLEVRGEAIAIRGPVGMYGYCAGIDIKIIEPWAVTDPLLAQLPYDGGDWKAGHFRRNLPDGYRGSVLSGENRIVDPHLHEYYAAIRVLTEQRPLLSRERLVTIMQFNIGAFDHGVEIESLAEQQLQDER